MSRFNEQQRRKREAEQRLRKGIMAVAAAQLGGGK